MPDPLSELAAALDAAAAALAPLLPSENGLTPAGPAAAADLRSSLPGGDARIVSGGVAGLDGATLVVALAAELADILEQGPRGMLDLAEVLRPALSAALGAMSARLGPLSLADTAVLAQGERAPGGDVVAAHLVDGERAAVTVALVLPAGALASFAGDAPEVEVDSSAQAPAHAPVATPAAFDPLAGIPAGLAGNGVHRSLDVLHDVEMGVTAELGRTRLSVRTLLGLVPGSVVELDRAAGSQVDLLVNGTLIARGEVVVIDDEFGVRISEVVGGVEGRR